MVTNTNIHPTATLTHWALSAPPRTRFTHVQIGPNPTDLVASLEFEIGREKEMIAWFRSFADAKEAEIKRVYAAKQQLPLAETPKLPVPSRSDIPL